MPATPERRSDRGALARRNREHTQDQQLSPFRRARQTRLADTFDASFTPNNFTEYNGQQHRRNFSQTGSFRKAFEFTSRLPNMSDREAASYTLGTPNRNRRQSFNPISPESNPPNELAEAYRQIDDAGSLVDLDPEDDFNFSLRGNRSRRSSSASRLRGDDLFAAADADFLNEISDDSLRRKLVDHVQDEKRLRRATSSRSPVLSNAGTINPLTSENLQRREEEDEQEMELEEDDGLKPSLNLPNTWGSRAAYRRDWLRKMTRRTELPDMPAERVKDMSPPRLSFDRNSHTKAPESTGIENKPSNRYNRVPLADAPNKLAFEQNVEKPIDGDPIPNTPIVVYKNSTFTKRSPTKRDSQDLLRKLSRTESPGQQLMTPETQKFPERRIYDKTPIVTGAWIDTPVTERVGRVNEFPEHLSQDIVPSPPRNERYESFVPTQPTIDEVSQTLELEDTRANEDREKEKEHQETRRREERDREQRQREERQREERQREEKQKEEQQRLEREKGKERKDAVKQGQEKRDEQKKTEQTSGKMKAKNKPPLVKPDLPKSALETVLQDFKSHKDSLDVGDDTIESLQDIIDGQPGELKTEEEDDAAYEKEILKKLELASSGSRNTVDLDRLNEKLKSLAENIQKVKSGLDGLEVQVSRDADVLAAIPSAPRGKQSKQHSCENCNGEQDGRVYALVTLPRLWRRDPVSRCIRLTRLGWCSLILLLWFCSESTMCDFYCHPSISDTCQGNCLLPDAPCFPYAIPTMLWRWLHLSSIFGPLWTVTIALVRLLAQVLGFWDGYVEEAPRPVNLTGEVRIHGQVTNFPTASATSRGFFSPPRLWSEKGQTVVSEAVPELKVEVEDIPVRAASSWEDDSSMDDDEFI